jgi:hypothetical protein
LAAKEKQSPSLRHCLAPHLACEARLRRLLFPVWAHVDLIAAAGAFGADHAPAE